MNARSILLFGASVAVSAILTTAASSDAAWVRSVGVSHCASTNANGDAVYLKIGPKGIYNTSTSTPLNVVCDVPSDTTYEPRDAISVAVAGYDNSATQAISVMLCRRFLSGAGGTCGNATSNGAGNAVGDFMLYPALLPWEDSTTSTFPYLHAELPPNTDGTNTLTGFRVYYP
ncbi:hypothetical protein [Polyangium sp. 6x1]|uniref:hypothetical protein n=1 Tax=Polyangium sp. 6x1 TaxID=3042689 RepID=UPI0024825DB0|nr:hypothetical protein [Polyangium sp. 6x1]MDI1451537.1 hypothetical protein [Polyangium sp. 6x1]